MNYELCKKLKDAGFPQENLTKYIDRYIDSGKIEPKDYREMRAFEFEKKQDRCFTPSLEELIEACGDRFTSLIRLNTIHGIKWLAEYEYSHLPDFGSTPLEAVANLWLELNK